MAAPWLGEALRAGGLPVVEESGCHGRGTGGLFTPIGVLLHHTAGPAKGDLPSLRIVRDGRPGLPGPLSQLMLSRAGVFHVIATGRANHAGIGDASFVPNRDGNQHLIGIEAESCGTRDDWTPEQRANYPRGVAALCRHMGVSERNVLGHKEWARPLGRKVDPAFWDMNDFRAAVRTHLNSEDDDDVLNDADKQWMLDTFAKRVDVGFMRDQIMTHIGKDPEAEPLPPEAWHGVEVARRVDVGHARDQSLEVAEQVKRAVIEALTPILGPTTPDPEADQAA